MNFKLVPQLKKRTLSLSPIFSYLLEINNVPTNLEVYLKVILILKRNETSSQQPRGKAQAFKVFQNFISWSYKDSRIVQGVNDSSAVNYSNVNPNEIT